MKKLYKKYFHISKYDKVNDKVLSIRVATTIFLIIAYLTALGTTAFAYFSSNFTSGISVIKAAQYNLDINPLSSVGRNGNKYVLDNQNGSSALSYKFDIEKSSASTASVGYCKITITTDTGSDQLFYTKPIGTYIDNSTEVTVNKRTISILIPEGKSAEVLFEYQWGSCSQTAIDEQNGDIAPEFAVSLQIMDDNKLSSPIKTETENNPDSDVQQTETNSALITESEDKKIEQSQEVTTSDEQSSEENDIKQDDEEVILTDSDSTIS